MRYQSTPEKEFDGDIIITDPCYIIREENGITKNDWHYCEYGEYMERLGIKNYLTHDTIYGDWGCTVFDSDTKKPLGRFCADAGLVSVFLLDEVLSYNPNFNYHVERPWTTTIIQEYRKIVNEYAERTCDDSVVRARLLGDFSMRGQESVESATKSAAAFCLSFLNTATVPAILWLEHNYNCDCSKEPVAYGALSTEHSVMCSNFAVDGDEVTQIRRLLCEVYPHQSFSMVSDSYDYWNLVEKVLPQLKDDIINHDGFISIRGDSGDPVSVITETVYRLWDIFGGTVNSKGYKVLNPHVKAIYGDSITPQRCEQIYSLLEKNGFAINNVSLGVGSFSMECLETIESDGSKQYNPYTRDTFGIAVKATYAEDADGKPIMIFKNPKTDTGHFKKSQRGCCRVVKTGDGYDYVDGLTWTEAQDSNELRTVFRDGKFEKQFTLDEVRKNLHGGTF